MTQSRTALLHHDLARKGYNRQFTRQADNDNGNGTWDLDEQRTHNDANEITQIEGSSSLVSHDRAGNMTTIPMPADGADDFDLTYDAWNRLVKVEDGEDTVAEYEYTGDNRRVVKDTYSGGELDQTRHFYYTDQWQCIEERATTTTPAPSPESLDPAVQYVWGDRYVDDLILRDRDTDANGTLDERLYALQDANWNVTALAQTDGDVIERYTYTAYGTLEVRDADFSSDADGASDQAWQYTYTTRRLDEETGLMYYRNRMYHAELGRFVSRDPIGYADGLSLYSSYFVPGGTDPFGTMGWPTAPRGWGQCCHDALAAGVDQDHLGGVICCDGQKVACFWKAPSFVTDPTVEQIARECIMDHELTHLTDVPDCSDCPPLYRAHWRDRSRRFIDAEECEGSLAELDCIRDAIAESRCHGIAICEEQLGDYEESTLADARDHCTAVF